MNIEILIEKYVTTTDKELKEQLRQKITDDFDNIIGTTFATICDLRYNLSCVEEEVEYLEVENGNLKIELDKMDNYLEMNGLCT